MELQHAPPEFRELASFHVPLEDFLEGETRFETVFIEGGEQRPPSPPPTEEERAQVRNVPFQNECVVFLSVYPVGT